MKKRKKSGGCVIYPLRNSNHIISPSGIFSAAANNKMKREIYIEMLFFLSLFFRSLLLLLPG
jgi:hypothetical protein